jgi:HAE1 family hydrophobic/amphiphilic exporter-1
MFTKILHRPAMAMVVSIILLFLGVMGIKTLPISQFPSITPPTVEVAVAYPGASANVLVDSVLIPLEQSINGVQGMRYMASEATSAGEATIRMVIGNQKGPTSASKMGPPGVKCILRGASPLATAAWLCSCSSIAVLLRFVRRVKRQRALRGRNPPGIARPTVRQWCISKAAPELRR